MISDQSQSSILLCSCTSFLNTDLSLPPTRDTGTTGWALPPSFIVPTGQEVWAFHQVAATRIIQEFGVVL